MPNKSLKKSMPSTKGSRTEEVGVKTRTRVDTAFGLLLIGGALSVGMFAFFFFSQGFSKEATSFGNKVNEQHRASSLWPHVRTAIHFNHRPVNSTTEANFLATHFDYYVGQVGTYANYLRQVNPNINLAFMRSVRAINSVPELETWLADHPEYDEEEFFLHYTQDTLVGPSGNQILVKGWREECSPNCEPAATATTREESRVPDSGEFARGWYVPNPNYEGLPVFQADMLALRQSWYGIDGTFFDWCAGASVQSENHLSRTAEYADIDDSDNFRHPFVGDSIAIMDKVLDRYNEEYADQYGSIDWIPCNTVAGYWTYDHGNIENNDYRDALLASESNSEFFWEVWMQYNDTYPLTSGPSRDVHLKYLKDTIALSNQKQTGLELVALGDQASDRTNTFLLGLAYLVQTPDRSVVSYRLDVPAHNSDEHLQNWAWLPQLAYDIGQPAQNPAGIRDVFGNQNTSEFYEWATGADPGNSGHTYSIYARQYENALVLTKMRQAREDAWGDATATTHELDQPYRVLRADGSVGDEVSQVTLRDNEAVILIRTEAPLIQNVQTDRVWSTRALISAKVQDAQSVVVQYGKTTQYGNELVLKRSRVDGTYSVNINRLTQGTLYHYRIKATGQNGATVYSNDYNFRTLQNSLSLKDVIHVLRDDGTIDVTVESPNADLVQLTYNSKKTPNVTVTLEEASEGVFTTTLSGLLPNEQYTYKVLTQQGKTKAYASGSFTPRKIDEDMFPSITRTTVEE
ncbi:MAG: hypothetical protein H6760_00615 [Candidatus Nomurabacteria bacterium]|nr:MAG: hypothetical protein H6760_00615 [Candidatus Nomurabacteria bacterium]